MANNRMWMVNGDTGEKVLIAKYFPSTGWRVFHENLSETIQKALTYCDRGEASPYGDTDWRIEYEEIQSAKDRQ